MLNFHKWQKYPSISEAYIPMGIEFDYVALEDGKKHLHE
jgi:hypothetical protein